jgi:hypothetical protein
LISCVLYVVLDVVVEEAGVVDFVVEEEEVVVSVNV